MIYMPNHCHLEVIFEVTFENLRQVVEAYVVCDTDEDLAANFLCDAL